MTFQHFPLEPGEFRLCRVQEELSQNGEPQIELRNLLFDGTKVGHEDKPQEYTALSYTWGDELPTHDILINGRSFTIRENLYIFLMSTYEVHEHNTWFWIDQLCIDQSNIPERNAIVRSMDRIYSQASRVRVFLGRRDEQTDIAFDVLAEFNLITAEHEGDYEDEPSWDEILQDGFEILDKDPSRPLAMQHLLSRPYWNRMWIIQEIWLAQHLTFQCGTWCLEPIPASTLDELDLPLRDESDPDQVFIRGWDHAFHCCSIRSYQPHGRWENFLFAKHFLAGTKDFQMTLQAALESYYGDCVDPRDKVFALLAMVRREDRIPVDYAMSVEEVFWNCVDVIYREEMSEVLDGAAQRLLGELAMVFDLEIEEAEIRDRIAGLRYANGFLKETQNGGEWDSEAARDYEEQLRLFGVGQSSLMDWDDEKTQSVQHEEKPLTTNHNLMSALDPFI